MITESIVYPDQTTVDLLFAGLGLPTQMQSRQKSMHRSVGSQQVRHRQQMGAGSKKKYVRTKEEPVSLRTNLISTGRIKPEFQNAK